MYRYILCESFSLFDLLPLIYIDELCASSALEGSDDFGFRNPLRASPDPVALRSAARRALQGVASDANEEGAAAIDEGSAGAPLPSPIARHHSWGGEVSWRDDACAERDGYRARKRGLLESNVNALPKCSLHVVKMSKLPFLGRNENRIGLPTCLGPALERTTNLVKIGAGQALVLHWHRRPEQDIERGESGAAANESGAGEEFAPLLPGALAVSKGACDFMYR